MEHPNLCEFNYFVISKENFSDIQVIIIIIIIMMTLTKYIHWVALHLELCYNLQCWLKGSMIIHLGNYKSQKVQIHS